MSAQALRLGEDTIPTIDLDRFARASAAERETTARLVDETCRRVGFLVVSGHGMPRALRASARGRIAVRAERAAE